MTPTAASPPPLLFSEEEMALEKVGSPAFTGASTGERLLNQRPDLYGITVQLLGQGTGIRERRFLFRVGWQTLRKIYQLHKVNPLDVFKVSLWIKCMYIYLLMNRSILKMINLPMKLI